MAKHNRLEVANPMRLTSWICWAIAVLAAAPALTYGPTPAGKAWIGVTVAALVVGVLIDWARSRRTR